MAYLTGSITLKLYTDSAQTEFPQELIPSMLKSFQNTSVDSAQTTFISLAASGSQAINLNGTSNIQGMYVYSDSQDVTLAINGLSAITYKAGQAGFMPMVVTSLTVANSSSTTATNVTVILISG